MKHGPLLLLGSVVTAFTFASSASAQMSYEMVQRDLGMNYAGQTANKQSTIALPAKIGMNYAGGNEAGTGVALVPMDKAIKTAENRVAAQAFSAELERTGSGPVYLIEFAGNGANTDVWINARNGKVEKTETIPLATSAPGA